MIAHPKKIIPKYSCTLIKSRLQESYMTMRDNYTYFTFALQFDYKYELPNNNYSLNSPLLQNIVNDFNSFKDINVKIDSNTLIIEKKVVQSKDENDNINEIVNDIKIFYEQIYCNLTKGENDNTVLNNNKSDIDKIINEAKNNSTINSTTPSTKSLNIAIAFLAINIFLTIFYTHDYTTMIIMFLPSIIMVIIHFICKKTDITIGFIPLLLGLLLIIILLEVADDLFLNKNYKISNNLAKYYIKNNYLK